MLATCSLKHIKLYSKFLNLLLTGVKSAGPWCYVDKSTCKHQPIADTSGLYYDNCASVNSTHTEDTGEETCPLALSFITERI